MKKLYVKTSELNDVMLLNGYSLRGLSDKINITYSHMSNVKNGKTSVSPVLAKRIADLFGLEIKDLFDLKEENNHVKNV